MRWAWALPSIERCVEYVEDSSRLIGLTTQGVHAIKHMPALAAAMDRTDVVIGRTPRATPRVVQARAAAKWATLEIRLDFPLLHSHALVGDWSALEATIDDLVVAALLAHPEHLTAPAFADFKIPLAEYESMDRASRMEWLVDEAAKKAPKVGGVSRFEYLLGAVGLSGRVSRTTRQRLWELQQIRNVIVHRGAVADAKFVAACPGLRVKSGEKIRVTKTMWARYHRVLSDYLLNILYRVARSEGDRVPRTPPKLKAPSSNSDDLST